MEEKLQQKFVAEEKLSFSLKRGSRRPRAKRLFLALHFFSVYCAQHFVYINYEERQRGITRMNVVACGNKKYNTKDGWTLNGIEQGSSE
jgi:hypothetical protein